MPPLQYALIQTGLAEATLEQIGAHMLGLMLRNIATDGYPFEDPSRPGVFSKPGCVIASPSWPGNLPGATDQWYVHNWTRDAALTVMELAEQGHPLPQLPNDYVDFAATCQAAAQEAKDFARACFRVDGAVRDWSAQSDGPALQTLALLAMWEVLDDDHRRRARDLIAANLTYLLGAYTGTTIALWEETERPGASFFARSVQLCCFRAIAGNTREIPAPAGLQEAITWLEAALDRHWDGQCYLSLEGGSPGYDPNIDIVLAALYGSVPTAEPKLLATAAKLHEQWSRGGYLAYAINVADEDERHIGPLCGRYPEDVYDGDVYGDPNTVGHPWALCTCAFAELCYRVATDVEAGRAPANDPLATPFFDRVGRSPDELREAGDRMLQAVVFHSDHLELSEQFDRETGFEKSVRNLTWSYSSFLSAVRARGTLG
jgi:glucoamylase